MLINLTDVFTEEEKSVTKEVPLELTSIRFQGEDFRILEKTPVRLTLANNGQGRALIEADAEVTVELKCDRCLREVTREFAVHASVAGLPYRPMWLMRRSRMRKADSWKDIS